jgi:hypothetical protein
MVTQNVFSGDRQAWLDKASDTFVARSPTNKLYYRVILEALWPVGHGIPGPIVTEKELRAPIDEFRGKSGQGAYKDVFRRVRELQGEGGFTSIDKEGVRYQLTSLQVSQKREPRATPSAALWRKIKTASDFRCSHCGAQEPAIRLSADHRVPRDRGGGNEDSNWQPLCEQCNNLKSSACQGCSLNCFVCSWAFPETYKPITIDDQNKVMVQREAEKRSVHQSDLVNRILRDHFNAKK